MCGICRATGARATTREAAVTGATAGAGAKATTSSSSSKGAATGGSRAGRTTINKGAVTISREATVNKGATTSNLATDSRQATEMGTMETGTHSNSRRITSKPTERKAGDRFVSFR